MSVRQQLISDIETLPEQYLQSAMVIIREFVLIAKEKTPVSDDRAAMFGCLRGKYKMADDFDAPIDDMKEYME